VKLIRLRQPNHSYLSAFNDLVGSFLTLAIPISIFGVYTVVEGRALDPTTAFTALAWITQVRSSW
jgi:hypothetical protein